MLTFDNQPGEPEPPKGGVKIPDLVEVGENNAVWFRVMRSKKELQVVDKTNGKVNHKLVFCSGSVSVFRDVAGRLGLGPRQIGAALAALRL